MERNEYKHLTNVFVPFLVLYFSRQFFSLLLIRTGIGGEIAGYIPFLASAALSAITFFALSKTGIRTDHERIPVRRTALQIAGMISVLVILMYIVALITPREETIERTGLVSGVFSVIVFPFAEEYIFRYLYYRELRNMSPVLGITIQAVMFAIVHSSVKEMIFALLAGIVLGIGAETCDRYFSVVFVHAFINLRSFLYASYITYMPVQISIDSVIIIVGVFSLMVLFRRKMRNGRNAYVD